VRIDPGSSSRHGRVQRPTARELTNLHRLDRSRLKVLVIQYCDNDDGENRSFRDGGNQLTIASREAYEHEAEENRSTGYSYTFSEHFEYLFSLLTEAAAQWFAPHAGNGDVSPANTRRDELAELFLSVLLHSDVPLDGVQIIVFELSNWGGRTDLTVQLQTMVAAHDPRLDSLALTVLDTGTLLRPKDFYRLDGHTNAEGHRVMADAIIRAIRPSPGFPAPN
jgi:hypothetical protein